MDGEPALAELLKELEGQLRRQAWQIVQEIIAAERDRRSLVVDSVARAFDAALARTRSEPAPAPVVSAPAPEIIVKPATTTTAAIDADNHHVASSPTGDRTLQRGVVKWFKPDKGFGFIIAPDGEDLFVHYSQVLVDGYRTLDEGEPVTYREQVGPRGRFATDVRRAR